MVLYNVVSHRKWSDVKSSFLFERRIRDFKTKNKEGNMKKGIMLFVFFVSMTIGASAFAANLGAVSGSWEARGHWKDAGYMGAVCEYRPGSKKSFKVKIYQRTTNGLYQEFKDFRYWPNSCNVTTHDLQVKWGQFGTFVPDESLSVLENGEKKTIRRWFVK